MFSPDPARNRLSACKVAAPGPALVCFGHDPPLRDKGPGVRRAAVEEERHGHSIDMSPRPSVPALTSSDKTPWHQLPTGMRVVGPREHNPLISRVDERGSKRPRRPDSLSERPTVQYHRQKTISPHPRCAMAVSTRFDDPRLEEVAEAFRENAQDIERHSWWCITRSQLDGERLHAHADGFGGHLDVTLWDDGAMGLRMAKGYRDGQWDWEVRFHGDCSALTARQILDQFIRSIACRRSELMSVWENVSPHVLSAHHRRRPTSD